MNTFKVANVTVGQVGGRHVNLMPLMNSKKAAALLLDEDESKLESWSQYGLDVVPCHSNPFFKALEDAYSLHLPVILSPDMIWLCIAQGFANHINVNAKKFRHLFVEHEGQKELVIYRNWTKGNPMNEWPGCFDEFSLKIKEFVGEDRVKLSVQKFTTTTSVDLAAFHVVHMDAMKAYFKYKVLFFCGIPEITLLGTTDDWNRILQCIENYREFKLDWWVDELKPVLEQFVKASSGDVDVDFWSKILTKSMIGSGSQTELNGWSSKLVPYTTTEGGLLQRRNFEYDNIDSDEIPKGLCRVPFVLDDNGATYDMEFLGGFTSYSQDPITMAVKPNIGWIVKDK